MILIGTGPYRGNNMKPVFDRGKPIRVANFKHLGKIEELFESGRVKSMIKMNPESFSLWFQNTTGTTW